MGVAFVLGFIKKPLVVSIGYQYNLQNTNTDSADLDRPCGVVFVLLYSCLIGRLVGQVAAEKPPPSAAQPNSACIAILPRHCSL